MPATETMQVVFKNGKFKNRPFVLIDKKEFDPKIHVPFAEIEAMKNQKLAAMTSEPRLEPGFESKFESEPTPKLEPKKTGKK